jgi:hypothetical protein
MIFSSLARPFSLAMNAPDPPFANGTSLWADLTFDAYDPGLDLGLFPDPAPGSFGLDLLDLLPVPTSNSLGPELTDLLPVLASDRDLLGLDLPDLLPEPTSDSLGLSPVPEIWADSVIPVDTHNLPPPPDNWPDFGPVDAYNTPPLPHRCRSRSAPYSSKVSTPIDTPPSVHSGITPVTTSQRARNFDVETQQTIALAKTLYIAELVANGPSWPTKREKNEKACNAYAQARIQLRLDGTFRHYSSTESHIITSCCRL